MASLARDIGSAAAEADRRAYRAHRAASFPPAFRPLLRPARYKAAFGGRGSAKSHSFAGMAVDKCETIPGTRILCVREVQKSLKESVKFLLEAKIKSLDLMHRFEILNTEIKTPGGGLIAFQGMQGHTEDTVKSFEAFDVAWVEEAHSLSQTSLDLLRPTIRKDNSELWFSWNPQRKTDPVDALFRSGEPPPNSVIVEMSWRDNPYFPKSLRDDLEYDQRRDPDKYQHVWLGGYQRRSEARVFRNWRVEEFVLDRHARLLYGGDWGFSRDPTVGVRMEVDDTARRIRIDHEVYRIGCEIDDTPALFDCLGCENAMAGYPCPEDCKAPGHRSARRWQFRADSARPETISYMIRHGYPRMIASRKGAGSVEEGVAFLQSYDIVVHPRCQHVIDELSMYSYEVDKQTQVPLAILRDEHNHVIDALRYAAEDARHAKPRGGLLA